MNKLLNFLSNLEVSLPKFVIMWDFIWNLNWTFRFILNLVWSYNQAQKMMLMTLTMLKLNCSWLLALLFCLMNDLFCFLNIFFYQAQVPLSSNVNSMFFFSRREYDKDRDGRHRHRSPSRSKSDQRSRSRSPSRSRSKR